MASWKGQETQQDSGVQGKLLARIPATVLAEPVLGQGQATPLDSERGALLAQGQGQLAMQQVLELALELVPVLRQELVLVLVLAEH